MMVSSRFFRCLWISLDRIYTENMHYSTMALYSTLRKVVKKWEDCMVYYIVKVGISAIVVVLVSEVAKRSSFFGALIASLPLTSLLAILWLHVEKAKLDTIANLSQSIFWLVLPSLVFFFLFPALLTRGMQFWPSLSISTTATIIMYFVLIWILRFFSIPLL